MKDELLTANVLFCLEKLKELLDSLPSGEGESVTAEALFEKKDLAEKALEHLLSLFGPLAGDVPLNWCKVGKPAIHS